MHDLLQRLLVVRAPHLCGLGVVALGERQRLALAMVLAGRGAGDDDPPGAVLLDEPTRGMDRGRKADLAALAARRSRVNCLLDGGADAV